MKERIQLFSQKLITFSSLTIKKQKAYLLLLKRQESFNEKYSQCIERIQQREGLVTPYIFYTLILFFSSFYAQTTYTQHAHYWKINQKFSPFAPLSNINLYYLLMYWYGKSKTTHNENTFSFFYYDISLVIKKKIFTIHRKNYTISSSSFTPH